ncbi:retinol dehydrogenase [Mycobacterium heckeshornense]|uniref:Short-chain dehydrogenase n=2 Tax=Mycobacterium TaxID=1763 RepID=A0A2G8B4Y5_9MYCO|nr:SDR family NAD(P)-dependent oxidoreductase [Mycobacterium heckeshornense]KMV24252.1 retinol dehydrogenase [Mycobacterium heckeshornense]MCV7036493.1 SDR family NAD(P)-dependent oxidoreductase [Mycobacterium heckeshornense]PIJ32686.1 retinol dehydrogenase [Mycobacterium heckeshornense]BCO34356.1 short-chain dehydrogenase [Mycobacterium heckeshornense]BCQ07493.1 short-chain dehydrogenase [Mycobacterium heckeshornense]
MRIIVTGGNSGVGRATASAMAAAGHQVLIACRTVEKGEEAAAAMTGDVAVRYLDLADLASVRKFADQVDFVDVLVNNAGVLGLPLTRTTDGFEAHMGTNHLGHFALTCLLGDRIRDRIVVVASSNYALARIQFDDLNWQHRRYNMWSAYGESKLANLLFVAELARRGRRAYASDPGMTATDITRDGTGVLRWAGKTLAPHIAQSPANGARSTIQAITTDLPSGTYIAPRGLFHQWGKPKPTKLLAKARDPQSARRLWNLSAELTGCDWNTIKEAV